MYTVHHSTDNRTFREYLTLSLFTLIGVIGFVYMFQWYHSTASKAQENTVAIKIKLQGEAHPLESVRVNVTLYKSLGKVKEFHDVIFVSQLDRAFEGMITLDSDFDYNSLYAIYIKPQKYFGKLFCSETVDGKSCTTPQFIFMKRGHIIDLTSKFFSGGDIDPPNGRVDAYDISRIISNLGKASDTSTDINNDGMTNTFDYLLALYSLDNNMSDDMFSLIVPWAPSPTITPPAATPTFPFPKNSPVPTLYPNPTSTPIPTITFTPTPLPKGECQIIPTFYGKKTCGIYEQTISASNVFGNCKEMNMSTTKCEWVSIKRKCTCPNGKLCICQLRSQIEQTVECSHGGELKIRQCD